MTHSGHEHRALHALPRAKKRHEPCSCTAEEVVMLKRNLMLVAVLLSVAGASLTAQGRQERFVNPVISSVAPVAPTGSPTGQLLTITGSNFAPGLTLIVTTPNAKKVTYSGDAIQRQKETSFDVRVVLASEGAYT